jgi:hypothetical protein
MLVKGLMLVYWRSITTSPLSAKMQDDWIPFLIGVGVLVLYLVVSALTEMGTKLPWKK